MKKKMFFGLVVALLSTQTAHAQSGGGAEYSKGFSVGYQELTADDSFWQQPEDDSSFTLPLSFEEEWGYSRDALTHRLWRNYHSDEVPVSLQFDSSSNIDYFHVLPWHALSQGWSTLTLKPFSHLSIAVAQSITERNVIENETTTQLGASARMNLLLHPEGKTGISLSLERNGLGANLDNNPFPTEYLSTGISLGLTNSLVLSAYAGEAVQSFVKDYAYGLELTFQL